MLRRQLTQGKTRRLLHSHTRHTIPDDEEGVDHHVVPARCNECVAVVVRASVWLRVKVDMCKSARAHMNAA